MLCTYRCTRLYQILTIVVRGRITRARGRVALFFLLEYKLTLRRSVDYCLVTEYKKKETKGKSSVRARAWINELTHARARATHASCVPHWRSAWEERARETRRNYKKGWPRTKVTICIDRSIGPVDQPVWSISPWALFSPEYLIRRTGDGGHMFRRVLALRQRSALRRLKLQPSIVAVHHHCAKPEKL